MFLRVTFDPSQFEHYIKALSKALDIESLARESAAILLYRIKKRFLAKQDSEGEDWPISIRSIIMGHETLFETGTLYHSIGLSEYLGNGTIAIETDTPYAWNLIKRPEGPFGPHNRWDFLSIGEEDATFLEKYWKGRINEIIEKKG